MLDNKNRIIGAKSADDYATEKSTVAVAKSADDYIIKKSSIVGAKSADVNDYATKKRTVSVLRKGMRHFRTQVPSLMASNIDSSSSEEFYKKHMNKQKIDSIGKERVTNEKKRSEEFVKKKKKKNKQKIDSIGAKKVPVGKRRGRIKVATLELCALLADFPSPDPNDTALHLALRKPYSEELIVDHLLKSGNFSEVVRLVNSTQDLPIHTAMQNEEGFSDRLFDTLIDMNPKGLKEGNVDGSLPIHLACSAGVPSIYALKKLVQAYPESLRIRNNMCYPFQTSSQHYIKGEDDSSPEGVGSNESESTPRCWWDLVLMSPTPVSSRDEEIYPIEEFVEIENETNFTPLHLAVLNHAPPEAIECLIQADIGSLDIRTSKGRTALDCGSFLILDVILSEDSSNEMKNNFAATELIDTNMGTHRKRNKLRESIKRTTEALRSIHDDDVDDVDDVGIVDTLDTDILSLGFSGGDSFEATAKWIQQKHSVSLINEVLKENSMLGPKVEQDIHPGVCPVGFNLPPNLDRVTIDLNLPVGFSRLRWALLRSKSPFLVKEYLIGKMKNSEVKMEAWDKLDVHIGNPKLSGGIDEENFLGATRKCQYIMPKSGFVTANTAHETACILEYNDYCFIVEQITKNPEVPFGNTFEAHRQCIVTKRGDNRCHMICSVSAVFPGKKPMIAWKIKNAMYSGCTDADVALSEVICEHAGNE